jgi:hypothetical protein
MGYGDEVIASGLARGAKARGKRIAFGNGAKILWAPQSYEVFKGNPNVAPPGSEGAPDLEWMKYYTGKRFYGRAAGGRWQFNEFNCPPGDIYLTDAERDYGQLIRSSRSTVLIEPNVKSTGACVGANKQWPIERYQKVADELLARGYAVVQMVGGPNAKHRLSGVQIIETPSYRHALAIMEWSLLYIGPEGGLHHGAAAMDLPAVVIFGGFNSPKSTGYPWHHNLTDGKAP